MCYILCFTSNSHNSLIWIKEKEGETVPVVKAFLTNAIGHFGSQEGTGIYLLRKMLVWKHDTSVLKFQMDGHLSDLWCLEEKCYQYFAQ